MTAGPESLHGTHLHLTLTGFSILTSCGSFNKLLPLVRAKLPYVFFLCVIQVHVALYLFSTHVRQLCSQERLGLKAVCIEFMQATYFTPIQINRDLNSEAAWPQRKSTAK